MALWIFLGFAFWPLLGQLILALVNRRLGRAGKPRLPAAAQPVEILARMYLWPIVCWRLWRALTAPDREN